MTTREAYEQARALSEVLLGVKECLCNQRVPCLLSEAERPLDNLERASGWAGRPFWAYATHRMCLPCRAYWYAEMATQALHELDFLRRKYGAPGTPAPPDSPATKGE